MINKIPKLFGTSGIRGEMGKNITLDLAVKLGMAISTYVGGKGKIALGRDSRTSSQMIESAITAGILQGGCDVLHLGMVPTPVVGYATMKLKAEAGVMITASHNPPEYNGIKFWNPDGMAYTPAQERSIEKIIHKEEFQQASWKNIGDLEDISAIVSDYMDDLLSKVNIKSALKVVIDCGNGAASFISPLILRKAGCKVLTLNCQPDGFFPGRMPEPSKENLKELMDVVKATGADIGIAHDGDADRMVTVDDKGNIADFDKLLALVASKIGGTIITTVDASFCVDKCMADVGGKVIRTKVGDVHVADAIVKNNASFGGEPSGTWLHPDFCMCPDGILSALRVIELVSQHGPLSKLLDNIPTYHILRDKIKCEDIHKEKVIKSVVEKLPQYFDQVEDVNLVDGVRISMKDGSWVLVRPSGTEPFIRITSEGRTLKRAEEIKNTSREFIEGFL